MFILRFLKYLTFDFGPRILLMVICLLCFSSRSMSQEVEVWKFSDLQSYIDSSTSKPKLKVINFWATWCAPCIKELPYYEEAQTSYKNDVEILLVSLDFADKLNTKVIPLLARKNIQTRAVLLEDGNYNEWIDRVDPSWTGALPATLFISGNGKRVFAEKEFEKEELFTLINELKSQNE